MIDIDEFNKESTLIIGAGLIGYTRITNPNYRPPTKEEVIEAYQNIPLFNRTVDTIVAHLRYILYKQDSRDTKNASTKI